MAELDAILRAAPDDAKAYNDRGLAHWRSLDLHASYAEEDGGFALLQRELCREGRSDCDDLALALADLGRAIDLLSGPARAVPLINRAGIFADRGETKRALADCDQAVRLVPGEVRYQVFRARVRQQAGDVAGARADLDGALQLKPHDGQALLQRAQMLKQVGDLDGARADLDDALRQPNEGVESDWLDQAGALRRALARPGDPGMQRELKDLTISRAAVTRDPSGEDVVTVALNAEAAHRFAEFTNAHVGSRTQLLLDGELVAEPRIMSPILGGSLQIAGSLTHDQAASLAARLMTPGAAMTVRVVD